MSNSSIYMLVTKKPVAMTNSHYDRRNGYYADNQYLSFTRQSVIDYWLLCAERIVQFCDALACINKIKNEESILLSGRPQQAYYMFHYNQVTPENRADINITAVRCSVGGKNSYLVLNCKGTVEVHVGSDTTTHTKQGEISSY